MRWKIACLAVALAVSSAHASPRGGFTASGGGNNGFTTFAATTGTGSCSGGTYTGSCIAYVDTSTGNDATCAVQPPPITQTPAAGVACLTITKASGLIRNSSSDQLLLNACQTWTDDSLAWSSRSGSSFTLSPAITTLGDHTLTGSIVLGYYNAASCPGSRPTIQISVAKYGSGNAYLNVLGASRVNNFAINGWNFYCYTRDPNNAGYVSADSSASLNPVTIFVTGSNIMFEDTKVSFCSNSYVYTQGSATDAWTNWYAKRNIFTNQYRVGGLDTSQGMFLGGVLNAVFVENTFDSNGWLAGVTGAERQVENHNLYIAVSTSNGGNSLINNILTNDPGGTQFRPGGTVYNNFFSHNSANIIAGYNLLSFTYNVMQACQDIPPPNTLSQCPGIDFAASLPSGVADHNIIGNAISSSTTAFAIKIEAASGGDCSACFGGSLVGDFTSGSGTINNVYDGGVGAGNGNRSGGWPTGSPITSVTVAANPIPNNTTVSTVSTCTGSGTACILTMAGGNVAASNATASKIGRPSLTISLTNNAVWKWPVGIVDGGVGTIQSGNCVDLTGSGTGCSASFPSPNNTVETYDASLGGPGTFANWISIADARGLHVWDPTHSANGVNNWIRTGFGFPLQ